MNVPSGGDPKQIGFPAELTSAWDATTGYSWKRRTLTGVTVGDPDFQSVGDRAVTPDNNTDLESGAQGWLEPDPGRRGWIFIGLGSAGGGGGSGGASACSWAAGLSSDDCVHMTVVSAAGDCSGIDTDQSLDLTWSEDNSRWESGSGAFTSTGSSPTGTVVFGLANGTPYATIAGVYGTPLGCDATGGLLFGFGGATLCGGARDRCGNSFVARVACSVCPGWYCVADTEADANCDDGPFRVIEVMAGDDTSGLVICSGPYESEAAVMALCGRPPAESAGVPQDSCDAAPTCAPTSTGNWSYDVPASTDGTKNLKLSGLTPGANYRIDLYGPIPGAFQAAAYAYTDATCIGAAFIDYVTASLEWTQPVGKTAVMITRADIGFVTWGFWAREIP